MINYAIFFLSVAILGVSILNSRKTSILLSRVEFIFSESNKDSSLVSNDPDHYLNKRLHELQRMRFSLIKGTHQK